MWSAAGWKSRAASAAQTHESIPPLSNTTARFLLSTMVQMQFPGAAGVPMSIICGEPQSNSGVLDHQTPRFSNALHCRIPNKFMNLQSHACRDIVGEHLIVRFLRLE